MQRRFQQPIRIGESDAHCCNWFKQRDGLGVVNMRQHLTEVAMSRYAPQTGQLPK
jgi:hypothetical protein